MYYLDIISIIMNVLLRCSSMIYEGIGIAFSNIKLLMKKKLELMSIVPKSQLFDELLTQTMMKIKSGSIMILDNNGLKIAEKNVGISDNDQVWGSANRLIHAGEKAMRELAEKSLVNQTFETDNFYLMVGGINQEMAYAILNPKSAKQSLGILRLHAQNLKKEAIGIFNT